MLVMGKIGRLDMLSLFGRMLTEMRLGQVPSPPAKFRTGIKYNELRDYAAKEWQKWEDY